MLVFPRMMGPVRDGWKGKGSLAVGLGTLMSTPATFFASVT